MVYAYEVIRTPHPRGLLLTESWQPLADSASHCTRIIPFDQRLQEPTLLHHSIKQVLQQGKKRKVEYTDHPRLKSIAFRVAWMSS